MIYFIRAGKVGPIKIGYCGGNPAVRLSKLQVGNHEALNLIASVEGDVSAEREWHRRFAHRRIRGEWFTPSSDLLEAIRPYATEYVYDRGRVALMLAANA